MAIARIKKIEIIGLEEDKNNLLALLQRTETVQLINIQEPAQGVSSPTIKSDIALIETIEEAISYLAGFQAKTSLLKGAISLRPVVYQQELKEVVAGFDYQGLLKELTDLRSHLRNLTQHSEKLIQERHLLAPWRSLKIPLGELHYTQNCGLFLGVLRAKDYAALFDDCQKREINLFCEAVSSDRTNKHLVVFYVKDEFERLEAVFKERHFNFVTLTRHEGTVLDRLLEINREILVLDDQIQDTRAKVANLSKEHFKLTVVHDYLYNIYKRQEADKNLGKQQYTFSLRGWVKERDLKSLKKELADKFKDIAIFISEPSPEEEIPVDLENNRLLQPFEFITKIYGFPKYTEIDPTPYLAPFFFLYFGFCVSDAGYGFILALFSFFILKKFKLGPMGLRFFRLFFFCGISTILIGALTGSWFGNLFDLAAGGNPALIPLKKFKDSMILLDPMKEPTKLLGIALSFGIIQVWFGNIVAAIGNIKNKRYLDILLDQVPTFVFLFGLTGLGLVFLKLLSGAQINLFKFAALGSSIALILTQGRSEKGWGAKLFYGVYNLYNGLSGYLSDILSYSRLWALGLVTGVMATTINLISIQFSQIFASLIPFVNKIGFIKIIISSIILIIIFISGHLVSFLMNLLGAFVHPLRLQFVEFFSKFFKTSGSAFNPFRIETKYINIK
jgi:V/A-type H+-transporting ATPase subunit I